MFLGSDGLSTEAVAVTISVLIFIAILIATVIVTFTVKRACAKKK